MILPSTAGVKRAWGSYEELARDNEVDIVYVSNVHPAHKDTTLLMLDHGKHVLCEKPLAVRALLADYQAHIGKQDMQCTVRSNHAVNLHLAWFIQA